VGGKHKECTIVDSITSFFKANTSEPTDKDKIAFLTATRNGDQKTVQKMLKKYPSIINARAKESITALHYAAYLGHDTIVRILLDAQADIHAAVSNGWTPLHFAASEGEVEIIELLLEYGADINAKDSWGVTPLGVAIASRKDNAEDFLLARGAGMGGEELSFLNDGIDLLSRNDSQRGVRALKEALRINPILAKAHQMLAMHYMGTQNRDDAQKHFDILKDIDQKLTRELLETPLGNLFQHEE